MFALICKGYVNLKQNKMESERDKELTRKSTSGCMKGILFLFIGVIALMFLIGGFNACSSYNNMVELQESVESQWSNVENVYQKRYDLIDNLVATVKGYADHEKETLTGVIEARAKATDVNIDAGNLTPEKIEAFQQAQSGLSGALSKLMVVVERYPDLKANQNFLQMQADLKQIESEILVQRQAFNEVAKQYNTYIRKFPKNIWAWMFDFEKKGYFEAQEGAENAPKVEF